MLNAKQFVHLLRNEFPGQIARRIKSEESIYFQMPYFAKFVQAAIDQGDFKRVERSFVFAERMLIEADDSLYNALCVSFIESIDFTTENGTIAFNLLPAELKTQWYGLEKYWQSMSKENRSKEPI